MVRDVGVVFRDEDGVTAWLRPETFEAVVSDGTLRVERVKFPGEKASYRLSVVRENHVFSGAARQGPEVDRAWRRLAAAAERDATRLISDAGPVPRRFGAFRDVAIDYRGLNR